MYNWIKPETVIPVHGEYRHMVEHINFAKEMQVPNSVKVENGDIVRLYPGKKPVVYDKAPSGRLYLDGNVSVEEDSQSIKERKKLSENGILDVSIVIQDKKTSIKTKISYRGLPINENEEFLIGLEEQINKTARTFSLSNKKQEINIIDSIKITCRKYTKEKTGKKPVTNINLIRI